MDQKAKIWLGYCIIGMIAVSFGALFNLFFPDILLDNFNFIITIFFAVVLANRYKLYVENKKD